MAVVSRKVRYFLFKVFGLLSIVRWPNVLFTIITQYIAAVYIFAPNKRYWAILKDFELHFIVASSAFIIAAGFIINSFYDYEKDLVNRPHKTLFDRVVSKEFCLNTYFVLNGIGLFFAALASWRVLLFFSVFAFGLWFYSHKLQKLPIIREVTASILSVLSVFSIVLYYQQLNLVMVIYGSFYMCLLLNREIIKNLRNIEGDIVVGNSSISTVWGSKTSKHIFGIVSVLMGLLAYSFYVISDGSYVVEFVVTTSIILLVTWLLLITAKTQRQYQIAHSLYKLQMAISVLYLMIY